MKSNLLLQLLLFAFLSSCADTDAAFPCGADQSDQTGSYTMVTTEVFGDCGSMGTMQVEIEDGVVRIHPAFGCEPADSDWQENTCSTVSTSVCDDGVWDMNLEWKVTIDPANLDALTGTLSARMAKWQYVYKCNSEYTFVAERTGDLE